MEWFYVCLIVLSVIIFVFIFPLLFSLKIKLDANNNLIFVKIKFFGFPIKTIKKNILDFNFKKKKKRTKLSIKFLIQFLKDIKIFDAQIYAFVGNRKLLKTLCFCGTLNMFFGGLSFVLKNIVGLKLKHKVKPCFFQTRFCFDVKVKMLFTLTNLLISFIKTKQKSMLNKKGEKQKCKKIMLKIENFLILLCCFL